MFLAKSNPPISLEQHTIDVENKAYELLNLKGSYYSDIESKMILMACHYHDIGKINSLFQAKLNHQQLSTPQVPHGYLAPLLVDKPKEIGGANFKAVLNAIYYHHIRDKVERREIIDFANQYLQENANQYFNHNIQFKISNLGKIARLDGNKFRSESAWLEYVLVKGILNRCDWAASGHLSIEVVANASLTNNVEKRLNQLRPLQDFMKERVDENIVLVASTGSGKTEGALLWLNDEKGFFTLPMKVSANSIYERVKNNYLNEVALLHSDAVPYYDLLSKQNEENEIMNYQSAKNLAYPLTVCTVDQIFKFAYKALGTEHLLATLRYSKVIVDELQSYDPKVLATIIYGLKLIHKIGGKFAIITATLPPFILEDLKECDIHYQSYQHAIKDRHKIKIVDDDMLNDIDFILNQAKTKKVLIICNTVASAQELYTCLKEQCENIFLLHSRFLKKDRDLLEQKVIEFSKTKETGICISTQIVEASLDIDFDVLFTQLSTIDSLIQRMGRVYRNRENKDQETNIYIYTAKYGIGSVYDSEIVDETKKYLKEYDNLTFYEEDKLKCVNKIYDLDNIKDTKYYDSYKCKLENLQAIEEMSLNITDANNKFREMSSMKLLPNRIFNENVDKIEDLIDKIKNKKSYSVLKELEEYCINYNIQNLYGKKYELIDKEEFISGTSIHLTQSVYEFDEISLSGRGLVLDEKDDNESQFL